MVAVGALLVPATAEASPGQVVTSLASSGTPTQLAQQIVAIGAPVSNVTYTGSDRAAGRYTFFDGLPHNGGVVLSTGSLEDPDSSILGPNQSESRTTWLGEPGDPGLDALSGGTTSDAAVLEFDVAAAGTGVELGFWFGSEEYGELTQGFGDLVDISIAGQQCLPVQVAGTDVPVSVGSVNATENAGSYHANDTAAGRPYDVELDGFTRYFLCTATGLTLGEPVHVRIAIADVGDDGYDSAVFLDGMAWAANLAPTAQDVTVTTTEDTPVDFTLDASDPDGDPLTYSFGPPSGGLLTGSPPDMTFTPDPGFTGTAEMTYRVSDGSLASPDATITVEVEPEGGPPPTTEAPDPTPGPDTSAGGTLPRTGATVGGLVLLGLALVAGGLVLKRSNRPAWSWQRTSAVATALAVGVAGMTVAVDRAVAAPPGPELAERLVAAVNGGAAHRHLRALQGLADAGTGDREAGTSGYDAAADYVADQLERVGFTVTEDTFDVPALVVGAQTLTTSGTNRNVRLVVGAQTPVGGISTTAVVVPSDGTPGCDAADFAGKDYAGNIAIVEAGGCTTVTKHENAHAAGAIAMVVVDAALDTSGPVTLFPVGVSDDPGLLDVDGQSTTIDLRYHFVNHPTANLIAETTTGRDNNVVVVGANLDSAAGSPGSNEASGAAALLELATEMGPAPDDISNAIRFVFFSGGALDGLGAEEYVDGLDFEEQLDIALYLDVDAIASPNAAYLVLDGDDSEGSGAGPGPFGSAQIESQFVSRFGDPLGITAGAIDLAATVDGQPFLSVGIPVGGSTAGTSPTEDPCWQQACDTFSGIDRQAMAAHLEALAFVLGSYGYSTESVNGVPPLP